MAILAFQRPDQVIMIQADDFKGIFEFRPLEPGFGMTIGNALRRILLSSLEGFAITNLRIEGVEHEFSSIKGVMQDVTDIVLNLKQIRFKRLIETENSEVVHVNISGQETFKAGDMNNFLTGFQVLNPELVICDMEPTVKLNMEFTIQHGRGYVPSDENKDINAPIGTIAIDSIHTPIKNVKYMIENYRVEQKTDYEKLVFEITTDGSIHPKEALKEAATILIQHFMLFSDEKITLEPEEKEVTSDFDETSNHIRQLLKTKMIDMNVSVRALNCLKAAEIVTLADLVTYNKADLLKFRNFGKKSLTELENLIKSKGFDFGMKLDRYKLDLDSDFDRDKGNSENEGNTDEEEYDNDDSNDSAVKFDENDDFNELDEKESEKVKSTKDTVAAKAAKAAKALKENPLTKEKPTRGRPPKIKTEGEVAKEKKEKTKKVKE